MSFSTLMVQLDLDRSNDTRLQIAGDLAVRFDARVIGATAGDIQPLYFLDGDAAQDFLEKDRAGLKAQMAKCEQQFRHALRGRADKIEWRSALEWPTKFVAREARAADLIVAGAVRGGVDLLRQVDPGELVLQTGRPVLVVPPELEWLKINAVVVGWKDTREARRAIYDALPLLHKANEVVVVELLQPDADQKAAKTRVDDVAAWLIRRGIGASAIATKALIGVPDRLVLIAQEEGANIIVAGAYGHARLQEWVFGGVTRDLLMQHRCCVFLSH